MAAPCWQRLLSDSYDGRVDASYPAACFHQAIAHIPPVVAIYSGTRDELLRALERQLAGKGPGAPVVARAAGGGVPVPLMVLGPGLVPGVRQERIAPQANVPILAKALGIRPPEKCDFPLPAKLFK